MLLIKFPQQTGQRYYEIHYRYLRNLLQFAGCEIENYPESELIIKVNNTRIGFDYSDDFAVSMPLDCDIKFKFHQDVPSETVHAFPPVSFHNWREYDKLQKVLRYGAHGRVYYNQRAYGNATERRNAVREILVAKYGNLLNTAKHSQTDYFLSLKNARISIHVPGFCNNMLDRAQLQCMAFGICTVSPRIHNVYVSPVPNLHYLMCKDDYSDLIEVIEKTPKEKLLEVGIRAKQLFGRCLPLNVLHYLIGKLNARK